MKKLAVIVIVLLSICSCEIKTEDAKKNIEDLSDEEFINLMEPYMADGSDLESIVQIKGMPSSLDALRETVVDILEDPCLSPTYEDSDIYKHYGKVFLEEVKIEEPILHYLYKEEEFEMECFSFLIIASHPTYGEVLSVKYSNNSRSKSFSPSSKLYSFGDITSEGSQLISRIQAKEYFESVLGKELDRDPIAVRLIDNKLTFYSDEDFAWYCAVPNEDDSRAIQEGNYDEYLLDPWVYDMDIKSSGARSPEEWDLDPRDEDSFLPTRVSRIDKRLNIYGLIDSFNNTKSPYSEGWESSHIYEEVEILPF